MAAISSNALFHFTSSIENLENILTNEFCPKYCYEELKLSKNDQKLFIEYAFPMVCFCDIPLSQARSHLKTYGPYGIGMEKKWGNKNGINPVFYFNTDSVICGYVNKISDNFNKTTLKISEYFIKICFYFKPCKGKFKRGNKIIKGYNFYNEREWRYVPKFLESIPGRFLYRSEYEDRKTRDDENKNIEHYKIKFKPSDIKYLIVENENEIWPLIKSLREIKAKYNDETVSLLSSKILTSKQIEEDF